MIQVNWKAAATVVTGATALAGWLTSPSPAQTPSRPRAVAVQARAVASRQAAQASTLEEQSTRLASRLRPGKTFAQPHRDPFHFGERKVAPAAGSSRARLAAVPAATVAVVEPQPFPYRLSGLASNTVDGQTVRTAIMAGGATGLVLASAGDVIDGLYRVERIDDAAVELTDTRDGRTVRLTFAAP